MYERGFTVLLSLVLIFTNLHMHTILTQMIKTALKPQHTKKIKKIVTTHHANFHPTMSLKNKNTCIGT